MGSLDATVVKKRPRWEGGLPSSSAEEAVPPSKRRNPLLLEDSHLHTPLLLEATSSDSPSSPHLAFLEELCEVSSSATEEEEDLVVEMMRSLEKEIGGAGEEQSDPIGALSSCSENLRQLFEASDDELGLPSDSASPGSHYFTGPLADPCSFASSAAEDLSAVAWALSGDGPGLPCHEDLPEGWHRGEDGWVSEEALSIASRDYLCGYM